MTRKITLGAASIKLGIADHLTLGNLDAIRDWGYAKEYIEGMWRMLQHDEATDYVLATGVGTTVRQFCEYAFERLGLDWRDYVRHDKSYERPTEVDALVGDASKAREVLGWESQTNVKDLAELMVDSDLEQLARLVRHRREAGEE